MSKIAGELGYGNFGERDIILAKCIDFKFQGIIIKV